MKNEYDLIIVGGGPGGIASVVEAAIFDIPKILLIEKGEEHSQTIRQYYKDQKRVDRNWKGQEVELLGNMKFFDGTKETTLDYFQELLNSDRFDFLPKTAATSVKKEGELFTVTTTNGLYTGKHVIIAIGRMGKPNKPSYPIPASIRKQVSHSPYECKGNQKLLVVGGGDSAVEYACQLTTINEVTLAYRKASFTRINDINLEMIERYDKDERLTVKYSTDISSVEQEGEQILVTYDDGSSENYDRIIFALGGTTPVDFLRGAAVALDENEHPLCNENNMTSVEGLYLVGDITQKGGGSIALAINHAYLAMKAITK